MPGDSQLYMTWSWNPHIAHTTRAIEGEGARCEWWVTIGSFTAIVSFLEVTVEMSPLYVAQPQTTGRAVKNGWNKLVFKKTWHNLISAQTSNVCINHLAVIACNVSKNLWFHFQHCAWEIGSVWAEVWDRCSWVGIYTQRVKTAMLRVGLAVKSFSRVIAQMALEKSHLTSQGLPPCCVQVWFISIELASIA